MLLTARPPPLLVTCTSRPGKRPTQRATASGVERIRPRRDLAHLALERVERDLSSVHVEPGYDRHWGLL
jgi:hypothetical protein